MLEYTVEITEELMDELEALFCEELQQTWLLFQKNARTTPLLKGYFDTEAAFLKEAAELANQVSGLDFGSFTVVQIEDQDWKMAYRHHLKPWHHGRLHWIPEWEREQHIQKPGHAYLYLDSGMAFGTGSHETTRLCAEALYDFLEQTRLDKKTLRVVDAGCGSGILALSAVLLGCEQVLAFDRDPEAVRVTRENALNNQLEGRLTIAEAGLQMGFEGIQSACIVANIQADVLRIYREEILRAWQPDGILILSGILAQEREETTEAFVATYHKIHVNRSLTTRWEQKGDWVSVVFEGK
jgi:ribosomal protein L11 methyltransferase